MTAHKATLHPLAMATLIAFVANPSVRADELDDRRDTLTRQYIADLDELAAWCRQQGLEKQADISATWQPRRDPNKLYYFLVNANAPELDMPAGAGQGWMSWREQFLDMRMAQGDKLYQLALDALEAGRESLALMLLNEAVREHPGHVEARKMIGFEPFRGEWLTPFGKEMFQRGFVWHRQFGWIKAEDVAGYNRGLRRGIGDRWIMAVDDAEQRSNIRKGWDPRTDHYRVTTNHSLQTGVELAVKLERLREIWRQVFVAYDANSGQLARFRKGYPLPRQRFPIPHDVIVYATRDEYNERLKHKQPKIEMTLGIYFDRDKVSHFFAGDDQHAGTIYHEAVHQLFQETSGARVGTGARNNFWIVEGIATYYESFEAHDGYFTTGGANQGRLPAARHRLLVDGFYVPFAEVVQLAMRDIQNHKQIATLYSQFAGQTTFLMHYDDGRYRQALVEYLDAVYKGRATASTLSDLAGTSYAELDRQYREFLQEGEGRVAND